MNPNFFRYVGGLILGVVILALCVGATFAGHAGGPWWIAAGVLAGLAFHIARLGYKFIIKGGA